MCSAKRHRGSILSLLLMLVMIFNITGTTLFVHSHDIDGVSIVHSHPYTGIPTSHSHTSSHATLIARIAAADMLISEPLTLLSSNPKIEAKSPRLELHLRSAWCTAQPQLRAPPMALA